MREDNYARTGDVVTFGEYPTTLERRDWKIERLNAAAGALPTKENHHKWCSYKYYIDGQEEDFMWYINVWDDYGKRYRGVYFSQYRPISTKKSGKANIPAQQQNHYEPGNVYWFELEDIRWKVLKEDGETALLVTENIIDAQPFYTPKEEGNRKINGVTICQNNYLHSDIRSWLNGYFLSYAFTEEQIDRIVRDVVKNADKSNFFACEDTEDQVFLLSLKDVEELFSDNDERRKHPTDYARCQGAVTGLETNSYIANCGEWWLRTPDQFGSNFTCCVGLTGSCVFSTQFDCYTSTGIAPAIVIKL